MTLAKCYMIASRGDKSVCAGVQERAQLETIYDWVTVAIFAGLVVLFLQRSTGQAAPRDSILEYLGASVGCAASNYFGNRAVLGDGFLFHLIAVALLVGTIVYIQMVLRPLEKPL